MGVDELYELGEDEMGVDEMGSRRSDFGRHRFLKYMGVAPILVM